MGNDVSECNNGVRSLKHNKARVARPKQATVCCWFISARSSQPLHAGHERTWNLKTWNLFFFLILSWTHLPFFQEMILPHQHPSSLPGDKMSGRTLDFQWKVLETSLIGAGALQPAQFSCRERLVPGHRIDINYCNSCGEEMIVMTVLFSGVTRIPAE